MTKLTWLTAFAGALVLAGSVASPRAQSLPLVRIGTVVDGPWERNDEIRSMFEHEILALTDGEFDVRFPDGATRTADWTVAGVGAALDALLADPNVDIVLALGVIASQNVCLRGNLNKPVIAPVVIDANVQRFPSRKGASGVTNLNYLVIPKNIARDVSAFLDIVSFHKIAVLMNRSTTLAIPDLGAGVHDLLATIGVDASVYPVGETIDELQLPSDVEAVYLTPLLQLRPGEFEKLVAMLIERRIPSFAFLGSEEVQRGILASLNHDFFLRLTRRVALNVQRILLGEEAGKLPTAFSIGEQLTINMATARAIDAYPPWAVLTDAVLINDVRRNVERHLTLKRAADEALAANLDLAVRARAIAAGEQDVALARAALLPQIDLSLTGLQIDEDRARTSLGQQPERTLTGSIDLNQIVFSEPALANRSIQRHLQNGREYERDVLTLDIVQYATTAYLNLLRVKTVERIRKDNLLRTRENLDLARVREALGTARAAEVLRWESELANNRKAVIEANSQRNIAEIQLNRLLHRPAEESFSTEEVDLDDPNLLLSRARIVEYMDNPWDFKVFRRFMVEEGLRTTPEIRALGEAIQAQERFASSASRAFWLPQVGAFASLENIFSRDGVGSTSPLGDLEDLSWHVGIQVSYPLFSGGAKFHRRTQAIETAAELRLELGSVSEKIEQRIRTALHRAGASYAGMGQARKASEAAAKTLELVEDTYSKGAATILDVLDAQNNARVAEETAADAVYDFLIDIVEVERSSGTMILQMKEEERDAFYERLRAYFARNPK